MFLFHINFERLFTGCKIVDWPVCPSLYLKCVSWNDFPLILIPGAGECCFRPKMRPSIRLARGSGVADTQNHGLRTAEDGGGFVASWALCFLEVGIGALHRVLPVLLLLFPGGKEPVLSKGRAPVGMGVQRFKEGVPWFCCCFWKGDFYPCSSAWSFPPVAPFKIFVFKWFDCNVLWSSFRCIYFLWNSLISFNVYIGVLKKLGGEVWAIITSSIFLFSFILISVTPITCWLDHSIFLFF